MISSSVMSIRKRILLVLMITQGVLVLLFALGTFLFLKHRVERSFLETLRAGAESLVVNLRMNADGSVEGLQLPKSLEDRAERDRDALLYAIVSQEGDILVASPSISEHPDWLTPQNDYKYKTFKMDGERYEGVLIQQKVKAEENEGKRVRITVFYAASREEIDDDLTDSLEFLLGCAIFLFACSMLGTWKATSVGLKPIATMSQEIEALDDDKLDRRLARETLPRELMPFAMAFDNLLGRIESAMERERRFTADAAHELRTPVAVLKATIQATLLTPPNVEADREAFASLLEGAERLESLCESLLLIGRAGSGHGNMEMLSQEDFVREIEDALLFIETSLDRDRLKLYNQLPKDSQGTIYADRTYVSRIVTALVDNALKHGGSDVDVRVTLDANSANELVIGVEDNGVGISKDLQRRLFERFARGDSSRARTSGGAGLGLSLCQAMAQEMNGRVEWDNAHLPGARFVWFIPIRVGKES